jgi:MOSC domain-containing protein YiiM
MKVLSVNVSPVRTVEYRGSKVTTAIFKRPVSGRVVLGKLGLAGDDQADRRYHGGEHMAVYAIPEATYLRWRHELGRDLPFGLFGENLTISGLTDDEAAIGDRFTVGTAEVEVSLPRAPCSKLAMVMDDDGFPRRYLATHRVGFYLRVVREGEVGAGDAVVRTRSDPARLTIPEVTRLYHFEPKNTAGARRALSVAALAPQWRTRFEERAGV